MGNWTILSWSLPENATDSGNEAKNVHNIKKERKKQMID